MATEIKAVSVLPMPSGSNVNKTQSEQPERQALPVKPGQELPREEPKVTETAKPERSAKEMRSELYQVVDALQSYVKDNRREFQFTVDEPTGRITVKIVNSETKEVIRQIPSEELLELSRRLQKEGQNGVLLQLEA